MSINMNYRPSTYWPESENREQRLTKILGKARRDITRKILNSGGIKELNDVGAELSQGELGGNDRQAWGSLHPNFMGGEYLPSPVIVNRNLSSEVGKLSISDQIH